MEKAWDVQDLLGRLKSRGLDLAEDAALIVVEEGLHWASESISKSDSKLDDLALPFLPMLEAPLKKLVDGINGKVDQPAS